MIVIVSLTGFAEKPSLCFTWSFKIVTFLFSHLHNTFSTKTSGMLVAKYLVFAAHGQGRVPKGEKV
jgi:hypothetical protein